MLQTPRRNPPSEVTDGLFAACMVVGVLAGIVFGFKLFDSITSS